MPNAAYTPVDIGDLTVRPHTSALEGKRMLVAIDPSNVELAAPDQGSPPEPVSAEASLTRDEVEDLRDACNEWLEAA